jgi:F-type H+-transporting ATPase subunit b
MMLTLIAQAVAFAIFIWVVARFIWPPLMNAVEERQKTIANGLAAAEAGRKSLDEAKTRIDEIVREARGKATQIVDQAHRQANEVIEAAKAAAVADGERLLVAAKQQIEMEAARAREGLRKEAAALAVAGASKVLQREIDAKAHADLLNKFVAQL